MMLRALVRRWGVIATMLVVTTAFAVNLNYPRSIENVLISEGGSRYTNHPRDPGGPTRYGVTLNDVKRFINKSATARDVKNLTEAQARDIYKRRYWDTLRGDDLPKGLDYTIFDYGVNSGIARSGRVLRRVLGLPTDDWKVTQEVLNAIEYKGVVWTIKAVNSERLRFLRNLRTFNTFGKGWTRRVKSVRAISLEMADAPKEAGVFGDAFRRLLKLEYTPGKAYGPLLERSQRWWRVGGKAKGKKQ